MSRFGHLPFPSFRLSASPLTRTLIALLRRPCSRLPHRRARPARWTWASGLQPVSQTHCQPGCCSLRWLVITGRMPNPKLRLKRSRQSPNCGGGNYAAKPKTGWYEYLLHWLVMELAEMTSAGLKCANSIRRLEHHDAVMKAILAGANWIDVAHPSGLCGFSGQTGADKLAELLAQGRLFAIDVAGHRLVPDYAFTTKGEACTLVAELIQIFGDATSTRLASWFESTSSYLDGKRPREVLDTQPDAVVAAARLHVMGPMHG